MGFVTGLKCRECARSFPAEALHVCDFCFGPLEVVYDYEALSRHGLQGADRLGSADDLAIRRPSAGRRSAPRSISAPG